MADVRAFITCKIPGVSKQHATKVKKFKKNLEKELIDIEKKMDYGRPLFNTSGCGVVKGDIVIGGEEYGFKSILHSYDSLICELEYLGLPDHTGEAATHLHGAMSKYYGKEKDLFSECEITWGLSDWDAAWYAKEYLGNIKRKDLYKYDKDGNKIYYVECPSCFKYGERITDDVYRCPKCKKIIKKSV